MNSEYTVYSTQYFTATIYEWQPILLNDTRKDIIIDSLQYLVNDKRIELNAFVIMNNHIHLIWQALTGFPLSGVHYSSAKFYYDGTNSFDMLKHYTGN